MPLLFCFLACNSLYFRCCICMQQIPRCWIKTSIQIQKRLFESSCVLNQHCGQLLPCGCLLMYWFENVLVTVLFFSVTIDSLYKVTEGRQSDIFHRHADGNFDPGCCFTIYHGNHMDSLDLVTSNAEEARTWVTGLRYLMAGISDEDSLAKRQRTHDQYPLYQQ